MEVARQTVQTRSHGARPRGRAAGTWRRLRAALTGLGTRGGPGTHVDPHELRGLDDWILRGGPRIH